MREWAGVEGEEQFSYSSYLILSAQKGGSWIERPVSPEHRLTLEIDCIRHYLQSRVVAVGRRYKIVPLLWLAPVWLVDYVWQQELLG